MIKLTIHKGNGAHLKILFCWIVFLYLFLLKMALIFFYNFLKSYFYFIFCISVESSIFVSNGEWDADHRCEDQWSVQHAESMRTSCDMAIPSTQRPPDHLATPLRPNAHQTHTRHFTPHPEQKIDEQEAPHSEQVTVIYRLVRSVQSRPINYFFLLSLSHYSVFSFFFTLSGIWGGGWAHLHTGPSLNRLLSCSFFLILTVSVAVCP